MPRIHVRGSLASPLCSLRMVRRGAAGAARWRLLLWRSALQADSAAMLAPGSRRETRFAHCVRCARTIAASQMHEARCARADPGAALLAAPQVAPTGHRPPRSTLVVFVANTTVVQAKPRAGVRRRDICGAEKRRARGRARSAHRLLTRRDCSSAATAGSEASFATGHETEHRREPGAQRRAAAFERRRIPAHGFASLGRGSHRGGGLGSRHTRKYQRVR